MQCPIPNARGWQHPSGTGSSGVMILGEAMGEQEADQGRGFVETAPAGSILDRAIRRIGMTRDQFVLWNVVPVQPPNNWLDGAPWEAEAIEWGKGFLNEQIHRYKPRAILALGNIPIRTCTGLCGPKLGVGHLCGFVLPSNLDHNVPIIACYHPSFMRRGKMSLFGVLMRCLRLAVEVAREGAAPVLPPVDNPPSGYQMYPTERDAAEFERIVASTQKGYLAYDIETSYSTDEEEAEEHIDEIRSIQFSLAPDSGIFMPWREPFIPIAKSILASSIPKLSWNGWRFDRPALEANGAPINGVEHDLMWTWHHWQPDLPRGLQFAAAMQGPAITQPSHRWPWPWKHLDKANPQFYGIVDVDVLQWMANYA